MALADLVGVEAFRFEDILERGQIGGAACPEGDDIHGDLVRPIVVVGGRPPQTAHLVHVALGLCLAAPRSAIALRCSERAYSSRAGLNRGPKTWSCSKRTLWPNSWQRKG